VDEVILLKITSSRECMVTSEPIRVGTPTWGLGGGRTVTHRRNICYTVNVKSSLCLTKHHAMKAYEGVEV
jgi:hypothetical protein